MWVISSKRCLQLQNKGGYYNTNASFIQNITLPTRYSGERLDYSLDISAILEDGGDRIQSIEATVQEMALDWFSYAHNCIIFSLSGGCKEQIGNLYFVCKTCGGRAFQIELNQSLKQGSFTYTLSAPDYIPNLVQFTTIQPLKSATGAFFFFG
ncbi:phage fiber-tail adaptor protein [Commensalibacter oyaizuii]|uniref:Uncharacterized protein n=1 Tax=Commensalibacter oyaizuii TaxID=3043873 RepID=A0ABT6Q3E6_9PROT|nr:hypothetical protein [Commensalibacter sp. TBRC 16381]MDI2091636.1 hypothetical protein [Commensalibacter sp. TBRC 16381]